MDGNKGKAKPKEEPRRLLSGRSRKGFLSWVMLLLFEGYTHRVVSSYGEQYRSGIDGNRPWRPTNLKIKGCTQFDWGATLIKSGGDSSGDNDGENKKPL